MATTVLVVDDHGLMREGLVRLLNNSTEFEVVGQAANGFDAVDLAHKLHPHVVLMDMYLPGMDGVSATRLIVRDMPDVKVVLLTGSENDDDILDAVTAGAKGYLLKDDSSVAVLQYIHKVATGGVALSEDIAGRLIAGLARKPKTAMSSQEPMEELTVREKQVLALVSKGLANKEIAHQLTISPNTARAHIRNLMQKIYVDNRTQLAVYGIRQGIKWEADQGNRATPESPMIAAPSR